MPATQNTGQHLFFLCAFDADMVRILTLQGGWSRKNYGISILHLGQDSETDPDLTSTKMCGLAKFLARLPTRR